MHDNHGQNKSKNVENEANGEVGRAEMLLVHAAFHIITEEQSKEKTRDNDVTKSKHREGVSFSEEILGPDDFNGTIERFSNSDHNVGSKHPKDVVEEESGEKSTTNLIATDRDESNRLDSEAPCDHIVGDPVLRNHVPDAKRGANEQVKSIQVGDLSRV